MHLLQNVIIMDYGMYYKMCRETDKTHDYIQVRG